MTVERTVTGMDSLKYAGVMAGANIAGFAANLLFRVILSGVPGVRQMLVNSFASTVFILLLSLFSFAAVILISYILFTRLLPDQYLPGASSRVVTQNALFFILPAEILRFLLSSLPLRPGRMFGLRLFDGLFTIVPGFAYNQLYLVPNRALERIFEEGYSLTDNIVYILMYLVYFLLTCMVLILLYRRIWQKRDAALAAEEKIRIDETGSAPVNQKELVTKQKYFYSQPVKREDRLRFAACSFGAQIVTYILGVAFLSALLTIYMGDSATGIFMRTACGIVLSAVLPVFLLRKLMKNRIPELFSLADKKEEIPAKLIALMLPGEAIRFACGLLPLPLLAWGAYTAPLPFQLYSLLWLTAGGRYQQVIAENAPALSDLLLFFLIYVLCFAVHEWIVLRMLRRQAEKHILYLDGIRAESARY